MPNASDSGQPSGPQVDERQVARIARGAALAVYGVTNVVSARRWQRLMDRLGLGSHGVRVQAAPSLEVAVNLELAPGVPRDSVLANVADTVRYTVQRDVGRSIDALTLTVEGR